jgi:hypothetical protein
MTKELLAFLIIFQLNFKPDVAQITDLKMDLNMMNLGRNGNSKFLDMSLLIFKVI